MRATYRLLAVVGVTLAMLAANAPAQERPETRRSDALKGAGERVVVSPLKERLPKLLQELVTAKKSDEQIIEAIYLAALTRMPTEPEAKGAKRQVVDSQDRMVALDKVLKSLMASPEFARLHPDPINLKLTPLDRLPGPKQDPNAPGKGPFFDR